MPSFTLRLLSSRNLLTNLQRYSLLTFLKKYEKKMERNVPSIAMILDRSGKNLRTDRELFAKGSDISFPANLAKLAVRLSSY